MLKYMSVLGADWFKKTYDLDKLSKAQKLEYRAEVSE